MSDELSAKLAALLQQGQQFGQGMSNAAAGTISAPVDGIAWLLRKAGAGNLIGNAPIGGSDWMAQQGLTRPTNGLAGLLGESVGGVAPMLAAARAPQIGNALMRMGDNAFAPTVMNSQAGMIDVNALRAGNPNVDFTLSQRGPNATLSKVVVPTEARGQGVGSDFMNALSTAADADGATVALSPSADFGGSKARLIDFYKRFGFVPNKGRNIDYEVSESMYRTPQK